MEAIEFQTTLGVDGIIAIPDSLSKRMRRGRVRVIVIEDEAKAAENEPDAARHFIKHLMANPVSVDRSSAFLSRDEIYDRGT